MIRYVVDYSRKCDGMRGTKAFASHAAARRFSELKKREPGWVASWPRKVVGLADKHVPDGTPNGELPRDYGWL